MFDFHLFSFFVGCMTVILAVILWPLYFTALGMYITQNKTLSKRIDEAIAIIESGKGKPPGSFLLLPLSADEFGDNYHRIFGKSTKG